MGSFFVGFFLTQGFCRGRVFKWELFNERSKTLQAFLLFPMFNFPLGMLAAFLPPRVRFRQLSRLIRNRPPSLALSQQLLILAVSKHPNWEIADRHEGTKTSSKKPLTNTDSPPIAFKSLCPFHIDPPNGNAIRVLISIQSCSLYFPGAERLPWLS